tara:strand:+ start:1636 stop:1950 length:315 start_codon:yes stop_codon:yes gene_type:complete
MYVLKGRYDSEYGHVDVAIKRPFSMNTHIQRLFRYGERVKLEVRGSVKCEGKDVRDLPQEEWARVNKLAVLEGANLVLRMKDRYVFCEIPEDIMRERKLFMNGD